MSKALYRKYRSHSFDEVLGQKAITDILKRAIKNREISHAYLLTGPHGVGKTSVARILAHEINELPYTEESEHLDIIEIDAASNNGVDDIRDLREKVHLAPLVAKYKVYIIDEVHMLSKPAFNALLKTLEEPPNHVVFILATTDADKLPATILSRVQRFNFRQISKADTTSHLSDIAKKEKIKIDKPALELIANHSNGSFRDSISLLDQLKDSSEGSITTETIENLLSAPPESSVIKLLDSSRNGDLPSIVKELSELENRGIPAKNIASELSKRIYQEITSYPTDLLLLDRLLEVSGSSKPYLKLLVSLGLHGSGEKNNPLIVMPTKATPKTQTKTVAESTMVKSETFKVETTPKKLELAQQQPAAITPSEVDWPAIVLNSKKISVALYSLLAKSTGILTDGRLTIYSGSAFNQNRLSDAKQQAKLYDLLESHGLTSVEVSILSKKAPITDQSVSSVADIMGGGEEVSIDA